MRLAHIFINGREKKKKEEKIAKPNCKCIKIMAKYSART